MEMEYCLSDDAKKSVLPHRFCLNVEPSLLFSGVEFQMMRYLTVKIMAVGCNMVSD